MGKKKLLTGQGRTKEEVLKYVKLFFVWLTIMMLAITAFILLYNYDNLLKVKINEEYADYEDGVLTIKDTEFVNDVTPLLEWKFYPNITSYEEYLDQEEKGQLIHTGKNTEGVLYNYDVQSGGYLLKIKNETGMVNIPVTLYLPAINSATWIYVDGQYRQGIGDVGEKYNTYAANQNLRFTVDEEVEILVLAENRENIVGGMLRPPLIAKNAKILAVTNNKLVLTLCIVIYAIIISVIGIWVYVTTKDKAYLWFAMAALAFGVSVSQGLFRTVGTTLIEAKEVVFSVAYCALGLYLVLICSSMISKGRAAKIAQYITIGINGLAIALSLFVLPFTSKADYGIYMFINILALLNILYLWAHAMVIYFKTGKKFLLFSAVSVMLASMVWQLIVDKEYIAMYTYSPQDWGYSFIMITLSFSVFKQLHVISKRSSEFNDNLASEVVKRTQKIESLLQERKEFTSMVAHDLKSPLASVKMMLAEANAPKISIDKMDKIINAIDLKVMSMTENLATLQRFNAIDMKHEEYEVVEVGEFIEGVYEYIKPDADAEGIVLAYKAKNRENYIRVPVKKLTRAMENIIYNAISFCKEDDRIDINYRDTDENVIISIMDSGCGIAPQSLPHIFDKFYSERSDESKSTFKGDGLGLYFVKILLEEIGGSVAANSWVDVGTEIILTIPLVPAPENKEGK